MGNKGSPSLFFSMIELQKQKLKALAIFVGKVDRINNGIIDVLVEERPMHQFSILEAHTILWIRLTELVLPGASRIDTESVKSSRAAWPAGAAYKLKVTRV